MSYIVRNALRRKGRTILTTLGVAIGIFALTVIGAMSEYFSTSVDDAEFYFRNRLLVSPAKGYSLSKAIARRIQHLPGVQQAVPSLSGPLDEAPTIGIASTFDGIPPGVVLDPPGLDLLEGRRLRLGDTYHAVIGYGIAETRHAGIGDLISILDHDFIVVGIWERSGRAYDRFAQVPLETAQAILQQPGVIDSITVVLTQGAEAKAVGESVRYSVPGVEVKLPEEIIADMRQAVLLLTVTFASSSVLAALIGGLFITNTMIMALSERVSEIGLKKAIGASDGDILREHVAEALIFGLGGWVAGTSVSWLLTLLMNAGFQAQSGLTLFVITPRLIGITLTFAVVLSAVGGLYPAWRAARLDPAIALRSL